MFFQQRRLRPGAVALAALLAAAALSQASPAHAAATAYADSSSAASDHTSAADSAPSTSGNSPTNPVTAALQQAAASGQPVTVDSLTDTGTLVQANPDGTLTRTVSSMPQRVQQNGTWVPIDTSLSLQNGTLAPAATTTATSFSDGGTTSMAGLSSGGDALGFTWPSALPTPVVTGDTATYPNVFPNVDLQLTADPSGYSSVLVLKSAAAASDPQLQNLSLGTSTTGVSLSSTSDGGEQAVDTKTGQTVFTSDTALMWDSSSTSTTTPTASSAPAPASKVASFAALDASAATPTARRTAALAERTAAQRPGGHQAKVKVGIVKGRQLLGLDQTLLHAKSTKFPVFVDPSWTGTKKTGGQLDWARISDNGWNVYNSTSSDVNNNAREGWDANYPQANGERARTYYQMDTSGIEHAVVSAATLTVVQLSAASCSPTPAVVYGTAYPGGWNSSGLYWGHEPALQTGTLGTAPTSEEAGTCPVSAGSSSHVSPPDLAFNVLSRVQTAAADGWGSLTLMVESQNMNDPTQWKQFATGGGASLSVTYSFPPQMTNGTGNPKISPSGTDFGKTVTWNSTPTLLATAFERAGDGEQVRIDYHVYNSAGTQVGYYYSPFSTNGLPYTTPTLPDGTYTWQAIAENTSSLWAANWTPMQSFTVDTTRPTPPAVTSVQFPARAQGASAGTHGTFVLNNDRSTTINGYMLSLDNDLSNVQYSASGVTALTSSTVIASGTTYFAGADNAAGTGTGTNGTATLSIPVATPGPHTLYVKEVNTAGTASVETSYLFYAGTSSPTYVYGDQLVNGYSTPNTVNGATTTVNVPAATTTSTGGHLTTQSSWAGITWADGHQGMLANNTAPGAVASGDSATFSFDIPSTGYWDIGANLTKAHDYGTYSLVLDSGTASPVALTESGSPFDAYSPFVTTQYEDFGYAENSSNQPVTLNQGLHTLTLTLTGHDPASAGFQAGIDVLRLSPITTCAINSTANCLNNTAFSSYTPANGSTAAAVTTANADGLGDSFNTADLTGAGWPTGGGTVTVNGAPITLPPTGGTWGDNMLASGQTVDMPATTPAPPVGGTVDTGDALVFLAFSTGGPTTQATGSITYNGTCNGNSSQSYTIDTVPDWSAGSGVGATLTLAHRNQSNNTQTGTPLHIYALSVPVDCPGVPVASIALPAVSFGVSGTNALHILGLGLRPTSSTWTSADSTSSHFTGTWEAADDTTWVTNSAGNANATVSGQTLRIPARISIGNDANHQVRVHLSNALGQGPVTFNAASVALQDPTAGGANTTGAIVPLTFAGNTGITLPAGSDALSDPVTLAASPQATLLVSLDINGTVSPMAGHGAAQNPVYITTTTDGTDHTKDPSATGYTTADLGGIPYLSAIDVSTPDTVGALVLYGDQSINADTGTPDGLHHLGDQIADAMTTNVASNNQIGYAILNGGTNSWTASNNLLPGGSTAAPANVTGPVDRAVLEQADVRTVLISTGTSDLLACPTTSTATACASQVETKLTQLAASIGGAYYNDDIENPDTNPIFSSPTGYITVYIATIPPSGAALSTNQEAARELVNTALLSDTVTGANCTSGGTFPAPGTLHEAGVVNFAAAVSADGSATDTGSATIKTADSFLSNKIYYPNDQYYADLATQYLSDSQNPCMTTPPN